jgi:hypothetical protein
MSSAPLYVRLDEAGFKKLLRGCPAELQTIAGQEVRVILADIGWGRIWAAVEQAYAEQRGRAPPAERIGVIDI